MRPALSRRLARAFDVGQATLDERLRIIAAAEPWRVASFHDLPPEVQELVLRLERGPRPAA